MKTIDKIWLNTKKLIGQANTKLSAALFFCAMLIISTTTVNAQIDSRGTDFWVMFNETIAEDPFGNPPRFIDLQLFISSISGATGIVEISSIDFEEEFTVGANSLITIAIPDAAMMIGTNTIDDLGIHITSNNPVTVYGLNQRTLTTDAFLSIPVNGWGDEYRIMAYDLGNFSSGSQLGVVANTDGTVVTITPSTAIEFNPANVPFQITLNEGETYQARTGAFADLTGTLVTSNQPVGVFGGHYCATVPVGIAACDHLIEMLPPVNTWGQSFVTTPFAGRLFGDVFRVLAAADNTTVTINSEIVATLNIGEFYETVLEIPSSIQTSNPVLVAQYMQGTAVDGSDFPGDPAMVIVAPVEQFVGNYTVSTPATGFATNHLNIVVDNNGLGSILMNGAPIAEEEFTAIPGTNFNSAQIAIELGTYTLTSTTAFGVLVYGANFSDSYAYPGGQIYSNVVAANTLTLAPANSEGPAFSQLCFTATLTTDEAEPIEGVRIDFTTQGANAASGFAFTNASGVATYCYSGQNTGDDVLTAFQGDLSQTVDVTWTEPTYDCLGVPNGEALPNTPCELDGQTGVWNADCNCEVEAQACSIVVISIEEITEPCIDEQPILDCVLSFENPNNESDLLVFIDYEDNFDYEDDTLSYSILEGSVEMMVNIILENYGITTDITFQLGDETSSCQASVSGMVFPLPGCIPDCEGVLGGNANAGSPCTIDGQNGTYDLYCECVPVDLGNCEGFSYYLADLNASGETNIYAVTLSGTDANLSLIATSDTEVHIAYNSMDNLIYAVSRNENSYHTINPENGDFGSTQSLGADYGQITAAVFSVDGKLLIGSQNQNAVFSVNVSTNTVSSYDTYSPITGGDLAFDSEGMLFLASRSGSGFYQNWPAPISDVVIGTLSNNVTGLAITGADQLMISSNGSASLELRNTDGSETGISYNVMLNGEAHTLSSGDMASGCNTRIPVDGICDDFTTFYVNHGPGINGSDLYSVAFTNAGMANMTYLANVDFEAHIAFNAPSSRIYFVNADGSSLSTYNPSTESFTGNLELSGADLSKITATFYNPTDGLLYVGDDHSDAIFTVDLVNGFVSFYANAPVSGGDLAIDSDGTIYLATKSGNQLYEVIEGGSPVLVGDIDANATGMAPWNDETSLVISKRGTTSFTKINAADASAMDNYTAILNGSAFSLGYGDMAAGCAEFDNNSRFASAKEQATISSFPNPTQGRSEVIFTTPTTGRALLEIYDMNGRNVATLFNEVAQASQEYRLNFDGQNLPNGVYIYRLTTGHETIITKFMIAK